jgi:acyl-CoA thioester hydrolase
MWQREYQLRLSDCDGLGHVTASAYLRFLEEDRSDWMMSELHMSYPTYVLRTQAIDYVAEIRQGAPSVTIELEVVRLGRSSLQLAERLVTPERVHARSEATLLMWDMETRRSRAIPPEQRAAMEKFLS